MINIEELEKEIIDYAKEINKTKKKEQLLDELTKTLRSYEKDSYSILIYEDEEDKDKINIQIEMTIYFREKPTQRLLL